MSGSSVTPAPTWPGSALSLGLSALHHRELEVADVDDHVLAGLVRVRLELHKGHGWLLLACIFVALASVVAVGVTVDSRLAFGTYAAAVAAGTVSLGVVAEGVSVAFFRRRTAAGGLSDDASAKLFAAAADAEHWLDVLKSCGHAPSDRELASFVRKAG
jgi:hypothetical protein